MINNLIQGQHLIDSFVNLLGTPSPIKAAITFPPKITGANDLSEIPLNLKHKLSQLFTPTPVTDDQYRSLFHGDITKYEGDHSAADLALIGYFSRQGLSPSEADQVFRGSKLYRPKWDEMRGNKTYGEITIGKAYQTQSSHPKTLASLPVSESNYINFSSPANYRPIFIPQGMAARTFIGPKICDGIRLFPARALSSLVALGAVGKTSLLLSLACHIAAGKSWNNYPVQQKKVAMLFCEETQEEISRKFSAITENWSLQERKIAEDNLLAIPLLGIDARLTAINKNQYAGSGLTEKLIFLLKDFELRDGLVILDHMQGFTAGDLNISETATAICREANKIVDATGAAVVMAAHISKNNIKATEVEQGFAVGSLAFENATRQMSGMIPMSDEAAKKYGLSETQGDYVWLALAKNSYGATAEGIWLKKVLNKNYHTVVFEPVLLYEPVSATKMTANEKLSARIVNYLRNHPFTTKNILDSLSGTEEEFKASKSKVREAIGGLIDSGEIEIHTVTDEERVANNISKQVTKVLRADSIKTANTDVRP